MKPKTFSLRAFTFAELLVVIAIIEMLAGLLLPALATARVRSVTLRCTSNQHQIAFGLQMYAADNKDSYPAYPDWGNMGGKTGPMDLHGGRLPADKRPMNRYVPAVETWHCPGDLGDPLWIASFPKGIHSCFDAWGNSYLTTWSVETMRGKHVTGNLDDPSSKPMKASEVARSPANKIIQGDWPWWADRDKRNPSARWHVNNGQARLNMLFGDSHTEFFVFPKDVEQWTGPPPDPNWTWW